MIEMHSIQATFHDAMLSVLYNFHRSEVTLEISGIHYTQPAY